jgi:organic radical activating enzyme
MKIDFEKKNIYNCDVAEPQLINLDWLENNPGQLFNTSTSVKEREMMLNNQRNSSCEFNCFRAEDTGSVSARIIRKGYNRSHTQTTTQPSILDITVGSDCNLTCTYCTKEFSSAWKHDIRKNGTYLLESNHDRYQLTLKDKLISTLSQNQKINSRSYNLFLKEIEIISPNLDTVYISGGEPFLQSNLEDILKKINCVPNVFVFTGLGVNIKRFESILDKLKNFPNVTLYLSCENIEQYLEFNRFGIKWVDYQKKVEMIRQSGIKFIFHSVLSNLSVFGFYDFLQMYRDHVKNHDFVYTPDFMSLNVLDDTSKNNIKKQFQSDPLLWKQELLQNLEALPSQQQINNLKIFLKEFTKRRNISIIDIYPKSFINWLDNVVQ